MGYQRLAYDDQDTTHQMRDDCDACVAQMHLPEQRIGSTVFDAPKRGKDIEVSDAAVFLADRLHLHLD